MKSGRRLWAIFLALVILVSGGSVRAQDKTNKTNKTVKIHKHDSIDPLKCGVCGPAYTKAMAYVLKAHSNPRKGRSSGKLLTGWLLLADGRHPAELKSIVNEVLTWTGPEDRSQLNWYRALTALFLVEYAKFFPDPKVKKRLRKLVIEFHNLQWPDGGWSYKPLPGKENPGRHTIHGMMSSIIYSFLLSAKSLGVAVPDNMLSRADAALMKCFRKGMGIGYRFRLARGEKTGARGGILMHGLAYAGKTDHPIYRDHLTLLPKKLIPGLEQAHHAGFLQGLGVVLGCFNIGPSAYKKLTDGWLDRLLARRNSDGSVCIDSDQTRFDPGVKRHETLPSTAVFALMILLRDPTRLHPPRPNPKSLCIGVKTLAKQLKSAVNATGSGELAKALKEVTKLLEKKVGSAKLLEDAAYLKTLIETKANARYAKAEQLLRDREVLQAKELFEMLSKSLENHEIGDQANRQLAEIKADLGLQKEIKASRMLDEAFKLARSKGLEASLMVFRGMIEKYPDTNACGKAKTIIDATEQK